MSGAPVRSEDHLTDFEALMWNLEKDPRLSTNVANLSILDRAPDPDALRATLERATVAFPRLRQRIVPVLGRVAPPRWQYDPDFDIDRHLKRVPLGGRASRAELHRLVVSLFNDPFDRTRPLWEFVVFEGLRDGRAAMLQRIHHTLTDGEGGLRLSLEFLDFDRHAPLRPTLAPPTIDPRDGSLLDSVGDALGHVARRNAGIARRAATDAAHALTHPTELVGAAAEAVEVARSAVRQGQLGDGPLSPLWTGRSMSRTFETLDVPFAEARVAAKRLGGTLNDLFVAGAAAAAGDYHRRLGRPVDELRMAMPISGRTDATVGGNMFAPSQVVVPTGELAPAERFVRVHEALVRTKAEPAVGLADALAGLVNLLPTSVVTRTGGRVTGSIDFVTSNLRAAPMDMYLAGALIESNYPMGPLANTAFNLTTMSYRGQFCMGVLIDTVAVEQPKLLVQCLRAAYRALLRAQP